MGKRTVTTTRQIDDGDDDGQSRERLAREALSNDPGEASYTDFLSKFRGAQGCRVKVQRQTPRGRQYCFSATPEEIENEETIRVFHSKQPYAHEEGTYFLSVVVNGEERPPFAINIAPQLGVPGAPLTPDVAHGGMADVVRLLQEQNARLEQRLLMQPQERTPMLDLIEGMARLDQMRGGAQTPQLPIEALMKAVEIGRSLGPGAAADDWNGLLISTLKENGPLLLSMLSRFMAPNPAPPQPPPVTPINVPTQVPKERISENMPPTEQERLIMKEVFEFLKKKAVNGSDPELYVAVICDNREDVMYAKLISQIVDEEFSAFATIDPDIEKPPYRDFFRTIYDRIKSIFVPTDTVEADSSGEAGNPGHAGRNGSSGKSRRK